MNNGDGRLRSIFEDQVNTFGVENTPAQFSCATSLSNLSLDDEPKIATDCLIKEMRLMNHPSDEQDDGPLEMVGEASGVNNVANTAVTANTSTVSVDNSAFSDSDESDLLEECINMGMNSGPRSQNAIAPPLPPRNALRYEANSMDNHLGSSGSTMPNGDTAPSNSNVQSSPFSHDDGSSSDGSDVEIDDILEQCIQSGIERSTKPMAAHRNVAATVAAAAADRPVLPNKLIKENPMGMFRQGGHTLPSAQLDEVKRHQQEGTPCNFSVMSALSDLTVDSNVAGLANPNR